RFDVDISEHDETSMHWKVDILFRLGILGVILDRDTAQRLPAYRHAFAFNEGDELVKKIGGEAVPALRYTLHPVLCETLRLDTTGNPELILPFDWTYIAENEIRRRNAPD